MTAGDLITGDYQIEWNNFLIGATPQIGLKSLEGWVDLPTYRIGSELRANRHGSYPGVFLSDKRIITADLVMRGMPPVFKANVALMRTATVSEENQRELPLVIQWDGVKAFANARCIRRRIPAEYTHYPQGYSLASLQWITSDPRIFRMPGQYVSTGLPVVAASGLPFALTFPLDFGAGTSGGTIILSNAGNAAAWPIFTLQGPLSAPVITNRTTGQTLAFKSTTVIPLGVSWQIDTNNRTVVVSGTTVSRNNELQVRQWFSIPPNTSQGVSISSSVYDVNAQIIAQMYSTDL